MFSFFKKRRRIIITVISMALILWIGVIVMKKPESLEPCVRSALIPLVDSFCPDYVIFENGVGVEINQTYFYDDFVTWGDDNELRLIDIDEEGAIFRYKRTLIYSDQPGVPSTAKVYVCELYYPRDDESIRARTPDLLLNPNDFGEMWQVTHYMPYLVSERFYFVPPDDAVYADIRAVRESNGEISDIPHAIRIGSLEYESEVDALEAVDDARRKSSTYWTPSKGFESRLFDYTEGCGFFGTIVCDYSGQFDRYVLQISMFVPSAELPGVSVSLEDWQYVVDLAIDKFIENIRASES